MRVFLLNDTSNWHCGSAAAMAVLCRLIEQAGGEVVDRLRTNDTEHTVPADTFDVVVVNGEGSFHHNRSWAKRLLWWIETAEYQRKPVAVVNALWCEMSDAARDVLQQCDLVTFREHRSREHAQMPDAPIFPDLALLADYPETSPEYVVGDCIRNHVPHGDESMWARHIGQLRHLNDIGGALQTNQHHGILAAGVADVPIVASEPNGLPNWKNDGLLEYAVGGSLHKGLMAQRDRMGVEYPELLRAFFARARERVPV